MIDGSAAKFERDVLQSSNFALKQEPEKRQLTARSASTVAEDKIAPITKQRSSVQRAARPPAGPISAGVNGSGVTTESAEMVEMHLRLNMDFQAAGQEGSMQRQIFIKDLKQDLSDASGMGTSEFNIQKVSPGSVLVDVHAPQNAAQEIQRQSLEPNSRLRSGKLTRFADKITLPRVMRQPLHMQQSQKEDILQPPHLLQQTRRQLELHEHEHEQQQQQGL